MSTSHPSYQQQDQVGVIEKVEITRFNWAGLGVVREQRIGVTEEQKRGDRCVPLSEPYEVIEVLWRRDTRNRFVGERLSPPQGGWNQVGCAQALRCPGCTIRHLSESKRAQVQLKSHLEALERLCPGCTNETHIGELVSLARDHYRARLYARLFWNEEGLLTGVGMWARWGVSIDLRSCPVQTKGSSALLEEFYRQARRLQWPNSIEAITIQAMGSERTGFAILHARDSDRIRLISELKLEQLPHDLIDHCGIFLSWIPSRIERRIEPEISHICGPQTLKWRCEEGLSWSFSLPAWLPQSPQSLTSLRHLVWDALACTSQERIFEFGCGSGLLSLWLIKRGISVYGADLDSCAIKVAKEAYVEMSEATDQHQQVVSSPESCLTQDRWGTFEAICLDGRRALAQYAQDHSLNRLLIHAMRTPLRGLLTLAAHLKIARICYIAPSAPSFARDLAEEPRYRLSELRWLDQTPGTAQLLTIATLELLDS